MKFGGLGGILNFMRPFYLRPFVFSFVFLLLSRLVGQRLSGGLGLEVSAGPIPMHFLFVCKRVSLGKSPFLMNSTQSLSDPSPNYVRPWLGASSLKVTITINDTSLHSYFSF
jgi:hypothetical protein